MKLDSAKGCQVLNFCTATLEFAEEAQYRYNQRETISLTHTKFERKTLSWLLPQLDSEAPCSRHLNLSGSLNFSSELHALQQAGVLVLPGLEVTGHTSAVYT